MTSDFLTIEFLSGVHPELTKVERISLLAFANKRSISHEECYGDGSIIFPMWRESYKPPVLETFIKTEYRASDKTVILDFDGTCVGHTYPGIGKDIGAVPTLKELVANGVKLILWTMRGTYDKGLIEAIEWFEQNGIELFGIQTNPTQGSWTNSNKPYGSCIIDDTAIGIPLKYDKSISERPFVDWVMVRLLLREKGYLPSNR